MKNKLLALVMAFSMVGTMCVGAVSASADDVITKGFDLVYNAEKSDADTRAIDVYVKGFTSINSMNFVMRVSPVGVVQNSAGTNPMVDYSSNLTENTPAQYMKAPTMEMYMLNVSDTANGGVPWSISSDGAYLGTLMLDVVDADSTFTATVAPNANIVGDATIQKDTLEVPAYTTGGGETKDNFTEVAAEKVGRFDEDKTTVPVDAWKATIDWSQYNAVTALKWVVTNTAGENGSVATGATTTVSGDTTVTYGLVIAGQAAQLDTITGVKLTVE